MVGVSTALARAAPPSVHACRCRDYFFHRRPPADSNAGRHDLYATSARLSLHSEHSQWLSQIGANVNVSKEITPPRHQPRAGRWNRHRRGHHGLAALEGHCWCRSLRAGAEKVPRVPHGYGDGWWRQQDTTEEVKALGARLSGGLCARRILGL